MTARTIYVLLSGLKLIGMCLYVPFEVNALYPANVRTTTEIEYTLY